MQGRLHDLPNKVCISMGFYTLILVLPMGAWVATVLPGRLLATYRISKHNTAQNHHIYSTSQEKANKIE